MQISKQEKIELIKIYIEGVRKQESAEDQLSDAFGALCSENFLMGVSSHISSALDSLLRKVIGEFEFDWIGWYIYETEFGTKKFDFTFNHKPYLVSEMTLDEFLNVVIEEG